MCEGLESKEDKSTPVKSQKQRQNAKDHWIYPDERPQRVHNFSLDLFVPFGSSQKVHPITLEGQPTNHLPEAKPKVIPKNEGRINKSNHFDSF
jgi:hypothetical protein